MDPLLLIAVCLCGTFIFGEIAEKIKLPRLIGYLFTGMLFSLGTISSNFSQDNLQLISFMGEIGIIFLLLMAGIETKLKIDKKMHFIPIAVSSAILPILLGYVILKLLGYSDFVSFILGVCLAISSEVNIAALDELKLLKTDFGKTMVAATNLDDIFAITVMGVMVLISKNSASGLFLELTKNVNQIITFPIASLIIFVLIIAFYELIKLLMIKLNASKSSSFSSTIILTLIISLIARNIGIGTVFGAYIAGLWINNAHKGNENFIVENISILNQGLFFPLLFVSIGLDFSGRALIANPITTTAIFLAATIGKMAGPLLTKKLNNYSYEELITMGVGLNSRGVMELVLANMAYGGGLIPTEIYSAVVFVAITTTFIFTPIFCWKAKKLLM